MADQKVSDLPSLNGADVDPADLLYIVDSSAGSAGSKKITVGQYQLAPVSGGTANGVVYLNGSKVVTTGSALVFDGSNLAVGTTTTTNAKLFSIANSASLPALGVRQDGAAPVQIWQALGAVEVARITSSGSLQVGTSSGSSPAVLAYKNGATDAAILARQDGTAPIQIWQASAAEVARITSGGDFGINGTPPTDSQFYSKNAGSSRFAGTFENHSAGGYGISIGTASTSLALFYPNAARTGGPVGSITTNGSSTSYVTSSDRRLKENIAPAGNAGAVIDAIDIVQHDWKAGGHTRFGVIAQDLNAVAPEAVSAGDDGEEIEKTWGVDYSKLVPMLIKEIQSLRARVAALESA